MALSGYHIYGAFDIEKRRKIVQRVVRDLRGVNFDAIAVRGVSGLIIGPIVAHVMKKHVIVVRKPQSVEKSHASQLVESPISKGRYIILDDFIAGGNTVTTILTEINRSCPDLKPIGGYCWKADSGEFKHSTFPETLLNLNKRKP